MNEYPKEEGWYWFRSHPRGIPEPVCVSMSIHENPNRRELHFLYNLKIIEVSKTWPQQWLGKIEEPKL